MANILVCDDEKDIVSAVRIYLESEGYTVYSANNGQEALEVIRKEEISLVLLDIMMPVMDGITAMVKIREISNVPVILLTAKSEDTDKILGLNIGADDYITKPFNPVELLARVKSSLRRYLQLGAKLEKNSHIQIGGIAIDTDAKEAFLDGERISLTPTEFDILQLLMENAGKVFSPGELYRAVWKDVSYGNENTVAVHIRHLREKIEYNPAEPRYLQVIWGQGYIMRADTGSK
ncbi:MAG: response regulator transcription factor [bacterium]|nr:response regulator transcription factor [bacterium]